MTTKIDKLIEKYEDMDKLWKTDGFLGMVVQDLQELKQSLKSDIQEKQEVGMPEMKFINGLCRLVYIMGSEPLARKLEKDKKLKDLLFVYKITCK